MTIRKAEGFYRLNDMEGNPKKTVLLVLNSKLKKKEQSVEIGRAKKVVWVLEEADKGSDSREKSSHRYFKICQYDTEQPELLLTSKSPSKLIVGKKVDKSTDPNTNMERSFNK
ncbi:25918_t:CDS:2 [Gigaspora rosea]|nr:25918_t:CDS:2 [Gigaspora rosea]